jgi:hypothetical protein
MSLQFRPNPFPYNRSDFPPGKGWEGITPEGRRVRVYLDDKGGYIISCPDDKNKEGTPEPLGFSITHDAAFVLLSLMLIHMGQTVDDPNGNPYYTAVDTPEETNANAI